MRINPELIHWNVLTLTLHIFEILIILIEWIHYLGVNIYDILEKE